MLNLKEQQGKIQTYNIVGHFADPPAGLCGLDIIAVSYTHLVDRHEYLRLLHAEMPGEYKEDYEFYKHKYAL